MQLASVSKLLTCSGQALEHARPENRPPLERLETELEERLR